MNFLAPDTETGLKLAQNGNGPHLLDDFYLRETISHFDHERIPERVVHARGFAVHGYFKVTDPSVLSGVTKAQVLTDSSVTTPTFVRFSTVLGSKGSADTVRDVRGFATRFYTPQGNWDIVGNNIPVFFIQEAIKFPDIIHAGKPEPHNEIPQAQTAHDNFWDFISFTPESAHMIMWILSDRTIPRSYRMMDGFGVHTFILVNQEGKRTFAKFHWRALLGAHGLVWDEALKLAGQDPDFHRRDLAENIEVGNYPEYELSVQLIPEADEHKFDFDILDSTKYIPEELVPLQVVGKMTLNRNVAEYFSETEQVAYCTQNVVPGIDFSDDPLLQGRNFSYFDTQLTRLGGPNFQQIPINRPVCPVFNNQRDGFHRHTITPSKVNYYPNREHVKGPSTDSDKLMGYSVEKQRTNAYVHFAEKVAGIKERIRGPKFNDHFTQATMFFRSMTPTEQQHIIMAAQFELGKVDDLGVRQRIIEMFSNIDLTLAQQVAKAIGVTPPTHTGPRYKEPKYLSPTLSMIKRTPMASVATRKIALIVADGYNSAQFLETRAGLKMSGCTTVIVGPRKGPVYLEGQSANNVENGDSSLIAADFTFDTCRSTMFDGIVLIGGAKAVQTLATNGLCTHFVLEAIKHYKAVLALGEASTLLSANPVGTILSLSGIKYATESSNTSVVNSHGVVSVYSYSPVGGGTGQPGVTGAIRSAINTVTSTVTGSTPTGAVSSGVQAFIDGLKLHRAWDREVSMIPA